MAAKDKNTRLKSNMTIAILLGVGRFGARRRLVFSALEGDVDIYTIIFAVLAVFIFLRLRSVLGQRTGSGFAYRLSMIAAGLCAVHYVAYEAKWYSALIALWRRMNINWHDPDLYSSLCLLAGIGFTRS